MSNQEIYVESASEKKNNIIKEDKAHECFKPLTHFAKVLSGQGGAAYTPTLHMQVSEWPHLYRKFCTRSQASVI